MKTSLILVLAFFALPEFCRAQSSYRPPMSWYRPPVIVPPRPLTPTPIRTFQFPRPYNPDPMFTVRQGQQRRSDAAKNLAEMFQWHVQPNVIRRSATSVYQGPSVGQADRSYPRIIENLGPNSVFPDHLRLMVRMPNGHEHIYLIPRE
jgi:hypothetical protein